MLRAQLAGLPAGYRADVAVLLVGGNDVTHRVRVTTSTGHAVAVKDAPENLTVIYSPIDFGWVVRAVLRCIQLLAATQVTNE